MLFPKFCHNGNPELDSIQSAPFCTLQKRHAQEFHSILKYCYKFTSEALSFTDLERQNGNLVLKIFNEYTVQVLLTLGNVCLILQKFQNI